MSKNKEDCSFDEAIGHIEDLLLGILQNYCKNRANIDY